MISRNFHQKIQQVQSIIIPKIKTLYKNRKAWIGASALVCLIIVVSVVSALTGTEVYSLTIDGKTVGYLTDKTLVGQAISEIRENYSKEGSDGITINENRIVVKPTDKADNSITALSKDNIEKAILASDSCTIKGWAIIINGKSLVSASTEKEANQILDDVKKHFLTSGSKVVSASFKETVTVTQAAVKIGSCMKAEDAVNLILTGENAPQIYTVKDGDTLWDIAAASGMSVNELQSSNPGFDPNKLKIGQQLNLIAIKPYLTVETKEQITAVKPVEFQTVYEETNTLYKGEVKVKTAGVNGSRQVEEEVTKENGVVIASAELSSVTIAEPQNQVALKGTKSGGAAVGRGGGRSISIDASGSDIVAYAKEFLGTPYVRGGSGPNGFDCSGFTSYVYRHYGCSLPRTASGQFSCGTYVEKSDLQAGDLVFFSPSSGSSRISHVGIYVGGGRFIHSPQAGQSVEINSFSYTNLHYRGAVRAE